MLRQLLFLFLLLVTGAAVGQTKFEHEQRIRSSEVPEAARRFVGELNYDRKIRWYKETSERDTTIEAKTKRDGRWHSIEFHRWGALEDVEIKIPYREVPVAVRDSICEHLYQETERFRVAKTQIQYSGSETSVKRALESDETTDVTVRYELVVKAETDEGFELLEFLFDSQGRALDRAVIIFKNTDHLVY